MYGKPCASEFLSINVVVQYAFSYIVPLGFSCCETVVLSFFASIVIQAYQRLECSTNGYGIRVYSMKQHGGRLAVYINFKLMK